MKGMLNRRSCAHAAAGTFLVGMLTFCDARAGDLVTLSGTTYHDVQAVRVEPDGVTWQYDEGMCKVDFTDSPKSVCLAYHYDPAKAAAYHDAQAQTRRQAEEQQKQVLQENEQRRAARMSAAPAGTVAHDPAGAALVYRRATSPAASAATRALGEQLQAAAAKKAAEPTGAWGVLAHSRVGSILAGVGLVDFAPLSEIATKDNSRASAQSRLGSGSPAVAGDIPEYATRTYFDDTDRAAAFARGVPLKP